VTDTRPDTALRDRLVVAAQYAAGEMPFDWYCPNEPSRMRRDCPQCVAEVATDALLAGPLADLATERDELARALDLANRQAPILAQQRDEARAALADLAALPARLYDLADELDGIAAMNDAKSVRASRLGSAYGARHAGLRDGHRDAARSLRALTPDPRQEPQP
jgi:hypothetical protein